METLGLEDVCVIDYGGLWTMENNTYLSPATDFAITTNTEKY